MDAATRPMPSSHTGAIREIDRTDASRSGVGPFSYVGSQSIGRISSPSAWNFSLARLAYTQNLGGVVWIRTREVAQTDQSFQDVCGADYKVFIRVR